MPGPDGRPWGTSGCATLIVRAPNFSARNLTIENAFDYVAELARPQGLNGAQAVAQMLDRGSDRSFFENVDIVGHQDTLFVDAGLGAFRNCRISGSVDFIFGAGASGSSVASFGPAAARSCSAITAGSPSRARSGISHPG